YLPPQCAVMFEQLSDPAAREKQVLLSVEEVRNTGNRSDLARLLTDLCRTCWESDNSTTLFSAAQELIDMDAADSEIFGYWGKAAFELGNPTDGRQGYLRAIELAPNDAMPRRNFANRLILQGLF